MFDPENTPTPQIVSEIEPEILVPNQYIIRVIEAKTREIEARASQIEHQVLEQRQNLQQKRLYSQIAMVLFTFSLAICFALIFGSGLGFLQFSQEALLALIAASVAEIAGLAILVYRYLFGNSN